MSEEGRNTFSLCSSCPLPGGGGAPVCGLLVLISGVCVFDVHFSFFFSSPLSVCWAEKGSYRQQPPKRFSFLHA